MPVINRIASFHKDMTAWRHDIHSHPETAFEEVRTADIVAAKLKQFGLEVHRGLAKTGVVGVLRSGTVAAARSACAPTWTRSTCTRPTASTTSRRSPARCTPAAMTATRRCCWARRSTWPRPRISTAPSISSSSPPRRTRAAAGSWSRRGCSRSSRSRRSTACTTLPGIPIGHFAVRPGPMMAAYDIFEIVVKGVGAHGAMPHHGIDPVVVGAHIVTALQTIVAATSIRWIPRCVSTTQIHAGDTWNVIPQECTLRGTVRTFKKSVQDMIEKHIEKIARNVAAGFGAEVTKWRYERRYPATVNSEQETEFAAQAAGGAGRDGERQPQPDARHGQRGLRLDAPASGRAATSGSATATARAVAWSTTRATTSTTRSCRSAHRTGRPWSSSSSPARPYRRPRSNHRQFTGGPPCL